MDNFLANKWSSFPNLYYFYVLRMNCSLYDFRLMNFRRAIKITSSERFLIQKFLFRFCEIFIVFVKPFSIFCVFLYSYHIYIQIKPFVCASIIEMLHNHSLKMFSRKNYCCAPYICRFNNYSPIINEFRPF